MTCRPEQSQAHPRELSDKESEAEHHAGDFCRTRVRNGWAVGTVTPQADEGVRWVTFSFVPDPGRTWGA
jgi:hypothetical protein